MKKDQPTKAHKGRQKAIDFIIFLLMWWGVTSFAQAYKCEELTQSEIFFRSFKSFILNFKNC